MRGDGAGLGPAEPVAGGFGDPPWPAMSRAAPRSAAYLVLVVGLAATGLASYRVDQAASRRDEIRFQTSVASVREAMARARDSGLPAATERVTLVQEIDPTKQPGFLIYVPVYRGGGTPETVAGRRAALVGLVYSPFRVGDFLERIIADEPAPMV